jgi:hypothetical protein
MRPEPRGIPIAVAAYAGGRGEEEPRALDVDGRRLAVREIVRAWREPDGRLFLVVDELGSRHVLLCDERDRRWWRLDASRYP